MVTLLYILIGVAYVVGLVIYGMGNYALLLQSDCQAWQGLIAIIATTLWPIQCGLGIIWSLGSKIFGQNDD